MSLTSKLCSQPLNGFNLRITLKAYPGQRLKSFNDGYAANDEFQSANSGLQRGELVRDLLRQRLQAPVVPAHSLARPNLAALVSDALTSRGVLFVDAHVAIANPIRLRWAFKLPAIPRKTVG